MSDDDIWNDANDMIIFFMGEDGNMLKPSGVSSAPTLQRKRPPKRKIDVIKPRPLKRRRVWKNRPQISPPFKIETLDDLLYIAWNYQGPEFDWFRLWKMIPALTELNQLVGMKSLKRQIIDMVLYYLSGLNEVYDVDGNRCEEGELMHTALYGPPGCGKTSCAHIIAKIYAGLGYLSEEKVTVIKRTDLVGKFVGHSEHNTLKLLEQAKGGVVFLDEAYSMGHGDKTESFSKAAIDTINQFLTENKHDIIFIIAGYEEELEKCFFGVNPGLSRRFPWRFTIEKYTGNDLYEMFVKRVRKEGWSISQHSNETIKSSFFEKNLSYFQNTGGDIEILFTRCKIIHTRRVFGMSHLSKRVLTISDLTKAFEDFKANLKTEDDKYLTSMYA